MPVNRRRLEQKLADSQGQAGHELQRILAQLEFAEGLCELHPEMEKRWRRAIGRAAGLVEKISARSGTAAVRRVMREAEKALAPLAKTAKSYTAYCVGHAHIDMNWMWSWPETVGVTNDTFSTVLRLMDEYPEFCFTQSQASVYRIIQEYNPALLERIRQRVREGRWEVAASHWVENDKNIVGGEALCRHLLYTRRFVNELFGLSPEDVPIDWSPDTFGHAATIPTYLRSGGVRWYYGHRLGGPRPEVFRWEAPDGARVLVRNDARLAYNGQIRPDLGRKLLEYVRRSGLRDWMFVYGVGDHGGGPTRRDIEWARELADWPVFPRVVLSTTSRYYQALEESGVQLPVLKGELNFEFTGCYTTQTLIKKANRLAETQLACAEAIAACAWAATGLPYSGRELRQAWEDTLFSHFHDILPGSGVHDTRTYTHGLFQKTAARTGTVETLALRALAAAVDTSAVPAQQPEVPPVQQRRPFGGGAGFGTPIGLPSCAEQSSLAAVRPFLVFNPCGSQRTGTGIATVWDGPGNNPRALAQRPFSVLTPSGRRWRAQVLEAHNYWGHDFVRLAFPLEPLPGLGYAVYTVLEEESPPPEPLVRAAGTRPVCSYAAIERSIFGLENEFISAEADPLTGGLRSLRDKRSGVELLDAARPAAALEYAVERPHGMSAWCLHDAGPRQPAQVLSLKRRLEGPYVASIEVKLRVQASEFALTYELHAGEPFLRLRLEGTWLERGSPQIGVPQLRMAFPLALAQARASYEIPFGALGREQHSGEEVPALRWAQVTGKAQARQAGMLLLNDSKHGHSLDGSVLRLTLIRSSYEPDILPEIGQHEMSLGLAPSDGSLTVAAAAALADALANPLRLMGAEVHGGKLPSRGQFLALAPESLVLSCLKQSEDGRGLILRFYETAGKPTKAVVRLGQELTGAAAEATEVDVLERPAPDGRAELRGGAVKLDVPPFGLRTLYLKLAQR